VENQQETGRRWLRPEGTLLGGPPAYRPRTPWGPGWALLATLVIVAASLLCAALPMLFFWNDLAALRDGAGPLGSPPEPGAGEARIALRMFAIWQAAAVLATLLAAALFGGRVRDVLALHPVARGWRTYGGAILVLLCLQAVLAVVQHFVARQDVLVDLRPFVGLVRGSDWMLAAAVIGIGAPLSEELLFRGFLLSALAHTRLGFWGAAVIATALWTALHFGYSLAAIIEVFIVGLAFSWLLWRTGSLRVAIFSHAVYNALLVLALRYVELPPAAG
jgi:membrane protease YdiL (CAAX protease family)